jgi:hypothetical protein
MKKNKYIVYGLEDPRDGKLFYVGKSCSGEEKMRRHIQPWSLRDHNPDKNRKIIEIMNMGFYPVFRVLEVCRSRKDLNMAETRLIRTLSKELNLLNRTNNRGKKRRGDSKEAQG